MDGLKDVFTFEQNYPDRPDDEQIQSGSVEEEYYKLSGDEGVVFR
jgi:hypothetical protein